MKAIIRSLYWTDPALSDQVKENFTYLNSDRLLYLIDNEESIIDFVLNFFSNNAEAPQFQVIHDYFTGIQDTETVNYLEDTLPETPYYGASFRDLFEREVESQAKKRLRETLKKANEIATKGVAVSKSQTMKGVNDAVGYLFTEARTVPSVQSSNLSHRMKDNSTTITQLYQERKANPNDTFGVRTGYGLIDSSTAGLRKKRLFLLAGFGGHLKSTLMFNMIVNQAVGGWNPLLFTSEMASDDVQQILIGIHSADPKFLGQGLPLDVQRLLLGALDPEEEDFFELVKEDLLSNPDYGSIRIIDSGEFTTFTSVKQRTIMEHVKEEVDILWVDYITRLPIEPAYRSMTPTEARNEIIMDAKRFSMSFDQGVGIPVGSPFQVNREGYKKAKASEGMMDKTALAQYNAAEKEADAISYIFYDTEEEETNEPKIGMIKSRWGDAAGKPVSIYIESKSRRIQDMTQGMSVDHAPTTSTEEDDVEI